MLILNINRKKDQYINIMLTTLQYRFSPAHQFRAQGREVSAVCAPGWWQRVRFAAARLLFTLKRGQLQVFVKSILMVVLLLCICCQTLRY